MLALFHALLTPRLHLVKLLLLRRVEQAANLSVSVLMDLLHLGVTIGLRKRTVLMHAFHLRARRLERLPNFRLLIRRQVQVPVNSAVRRAGSGP